MAEKKEKIDSVTNAIYKMDGTLDKEANTLDEIVASLSASTVKKYAVNAPDGKLVSFFNQISVHNIYHTTGVQSSDATVKSTMQQFGNDLGVANMLIDRSRVETLTNYESIYNLIPECTLGVETYVSNILSPDDFTKAIFNIEYDDAGATEEEKNKKTSILSKANKLVKTYKLNELTEDCVSKVVRQGEAYIAVLAYDDEFKKMVNSGGSSILTESYDVEGKTHPFLESIELGSKNTKFESSVLTESAMTPEVCDYFGVDSGNGKKEKKTLLTETYNAIAKIVDQNVKICKSSDILREASEMYDDFGKYIQNSSDIDLDKTNKENGNKTKKSKLSSSSLKGKDFNINGSIIRELDSRQVVPLEIDKVCFGYFYIEYEDTPENAAGAIMNLKGNVVNSNVPGSAFGVSRNDNATNLSYQSPAAKMLNTSDEMLMFISKVFLDAISKKIDKKVINDNKEFKDVIYQLVRQDYIRNKQIRVTYFSPDEVVKFETDSIFRSITFYAKLYVAVLTNDIIVKLGKSHDKRVYYVKVGNDKNQNAVVQQVIRNIKTKEFTYGNLGSLNSILSNSTGAGDDYFIPVTPSGDRPVDIETLPGMSQDENKELLDFIKDSIINGMGLPTALVTDRQQNIEFARNISQQNIQFSRKITRQQSDLEPSFTKLLRILLANELKYNSDAESVSLEGINYEKLHITFPSPMSLNLTNLLEQSTSVSQMADFILDTIEPAKQDGSNNDKRLMLRKNIVKKLMPGIEWSEYEQLEKSGDIEDNKEQLKAKRKSKASKSDPDAVDDTGGFGGIPY